MDIHSLIASGNTQQAIDYLLTTQHRDEVLLLSSRYNRIKKDENLGMCTFQEASREYNKINNALLQLIPMTQTVITINISTKQAFETSISNLPIEKLIEVVTQEFTGKPVMEEWLPIKQKYDSYKLLNKVFPEDYLGTVKNQLLNLYNKYWSESENKDSERIKLSLNNIRESLNKEINEKMLTDCLNNFLVFFITEKGEYDRPKFAGKEHIQFLKTKIQSEDIQLLKELRPELFLNELEKIHSELITIVNRMITNIEG